METQGCALQLPEILEGVFYEFDSIRNLAAALRVNKAWFDCASRVLRRRPPCTALAAVVTRHRQQMYADHVEHLTFFGDEGRFHSAFSELRFPKLKSVSLDAFRPTPFSEGATWRGNDPAVQGSPVLQIQQYFSPELQLLSIYGSPLSDGMLQSLRCKSTKLWYLLIDSPGPGVTPDGFRRFVQDYPSLSEVEFTYDMDHLVTDEVMMHFAYRRLVRLSIGRTVSLELLRRIGAEIASPFPVLEDLELTLPSTAISTLVGLIKNIAILRVQLTESSRHDVLKRVTELSELQVLSVVYNIDTEITKEELMHLKSLKNLHKLEIAGSEALFVTVRCRFHDGDFASLFSALTKMENLVFGVQGSLTALSLGHLAEYCKYLEECTLQCALDMADLHLASRAGIMFPSLRLLDVVDFTAPVHSTDTIE